MSDMNQCQFTGRLTAAPESAVTSNNNTVAHFRLAINGYRDGDTIFLDCDCWSKTAEVAAQYLSKGSRVAVSGRLQSNEYQKKDGTTVQGVKLTVRDLTFLDSKQDRRDDAVLVAGGGVEDDDIPF